MSGLGQKYGKLPSEVRDSDAYNLRVENLLTIARQANAPAPVEDEQWA